MTLKAYVKKKGSIEAAARGLEVPWQTLWRWLKGKAKPSAAYKRLLKAEGIKV